MPNPEVTALRAALAARVRPPELADMRKGFDATGLARGVPADVVVTPCDANGVVAEWTSTPDADAKQAVLYLHGGGYVLGSIDSHRTLAAEVGRAAVSRTLALHYRLAPEHPFPAAVDDALAGYKYLLAQGIAANKIVIA